MFLFSFFFALEATRHLSNEGVAEYVKGDREDELFLVGLGLALKMMRGARKNNSFLLEFWSPRFSLTDSRSILK